MKARISFLLTLTLLAVTDGLHAQGTAFTYQGQLHSNGSPASGTYNLTFLLFNVNSGGTLVAGPVTTNNVIITNGLFTVLIDFGPGVFTGTNYWLEIGVETNGAGSFSTLTPRQPLTPTPYAIYAESVTASGVSGTLTNGQLAHSAVTVDTGPGLSGGGKVGLGNTITLTNTGVLSVTGNADITAATVGGAVTLGDTATSADTPSTLVKRDGSGNFSTASITLDGVLTLPAITLSTPDVIYSGGNLLLYNDTNGNSFSGASAGNSATTGSGNTANGNAALTYNENGIYNEAIGYQALFSNTSGSYNAANGASALAYNTSGDYNTANGGAALFFNVNGSANTANGYTALYSNTSGSGNTANGCGAMYSNTYGSNNTANGQNALLANTSGNYNTANGYEALYSNTNGSYNTASGFESLYSNTSGNNNTANGYGALNFNTNGSGNTANGYNSLVNNTSGSDNVANGRAALYHNTSGVQNTAVGVQALNDNTDGIQNTAVGYQALYSNTGGGGAGVNNTAIGWEALYSNTSGSANIALGALAGEHLTTGYNNIDIYDAGTAGDNGVIRIGTPGVQTKTFIAGISGVTISPSGGAVYVNANGELGTVNSSRRFKEAIQDMASQSDILLSLRPVSFHYKPDLDPQLTPQYGLIAEEVEKVAPQLVLRDAKGEVLSVRYEQINAMLLNEFLKEHRAVEEQKAELETLKEKANQVDSLEKRLNELEQVVQSLRPGLGH